MSEDKLQASQTFINWLEMFGQLNVNDFVRLQMPKLDRGDVLDEKLRNSAIKVMTRLVQRMAEKGQLELATNQDLEKTDATQLYYQIKS